MSLLRRIIPKKEFHVLATLELSSCTGIRSLIDKYNKPEFRKPRRDPDRKSTWSNLTLLRLPFIDPEIGKAAVSKASQHVSPFDLSFTRPYRVSRASPSRTDYVALEYRSPTLSLIVQELQEELFRLKEAYAHAMSTHLEDKRAKTFRRKILLGKDDGPPHVTVASKLYGDESERILRDLEESFEQPRIKDSYAVYVTGLEYAELNSHGAKPMYLESHKFPFVYQTPAEPDLEGDIEVPKQQIWRPLGADYQW